jgi:hypothetical protein
MRCCSRRWADTVTYRYDHIAYSNVHTSLSSQLQDDVAMGAAAVGDGLSGGRQRQGLGQSVQSIGGDA